MLSEFIYSFLFIVLLLGFITKLTKNINSSYDDLLYFNKGIHKYFNNHVCIKNLNCKMNKLTYKNMKIIIDNKNTKQNDLRGFYDNFIEKTYKKLQKKNISFGKQ
jgi:hypothetical protein